MVEPRRLALAEVRLTAPNQATIRSRRRTVNHGLRAAQNSTNAPPTRRRYPPDERVLEVVEMVWDFAFVVPIWIVIPVAMIVIVLGWKVAKLLWAALSN